MKKIVKTAMFAVALVAAGYGAYSAYETYESRNDFNVSLLEDNLNAISESKTSSKKYEACFNLEGSYYHGGYYICPNGTDTEANAPKCNDQDGSASFCAETKYCYHY